MLYIYTVFYVFFTCRQLVLISELYGAQEVHDYLLPLGIALAADKVSEVRADAYHLVSVCCIAEMLGHVCPSDLKQISSYMVPRP